MSNVWFSGFENHEEYNHPILHKHQELLTKIIDDRVFSVGYSKENDFYITEQCDEYFSHVLTKSECMEISELFKEIADEID